MAADEVGKNAAEQRYHSRDVPVGGAKAPLRAIDDNRQISVGRYELRIKACLLYTSFAHNLQKHKM